MATSTPQNGLDLHNLTGGQIQTVLDFWLYNALRPIVMYSSVFDIQLIHMLYVASTNKKRKISALEKKDHVNKLALVLIEQDRETKFKLISELKTERKFVTEFVGNFLKETADFLPLYYASLTKVGVDQLLIDRRIATLEKSLGMSREHLFLAVRDSRIYLEQYIAFRNKIVENYIKHAFNHARGLVKSKRTQKLDQKDVHQNLMAAIIKGVDKYDSSCGAVTSYINFWILNGKTYSPPDHGHEYGIAYTIPQTQKKDIATKKSSQFNVGVSLNQLVGDDEQSSEFADLLVGEKSVEETVIENDEEYNTLLLIKRADPTGIARLYLDVEEIYFKREKRKMRETMIDQLGVDPKVVTPQLFVKKSGE